MTLIEITKQAIRNIKNPRSFKTERGYQGELLTNLNNLLSECDLLSPEYVVEQEYQKTIPRHNLKQRPDIIIHIPTEDIGSENVRDNNFTVFALKLNGNETNALEDFNKLDEMFDKLGYPHGIFINIGGYPNSFLNLYAGDYKDRIHEIAIDLGENNKVNILHSFFLNGQLVQVNE